MGASYKKMKRENELLKNENAHLKNWINILTKNILKLEKENDKLKSDSSFSHQFSEGEFVFRSDNPAKVARDVIDTIGLTLSSEGENRFNEWEEYCNKNGLYINAQNVLAMLGYVGNADVLFKDDIGMSVRIKKDASSTIHDKWERASGGRNHSGKEGKETIIPLDKFTKISLGEPHIELSQSVKDSKEKAIAFVKLLIEKGVSKNDAFDILMSGKSIQIISPKEDDSSTPHQFLHKDGGICADEEMEAFNAKKLFFDSKSENIVDTQAIFHKKLFDSYDKHANELFEKSLEQNAHNLKMINAVADKLSLLYPCSREKVFSIARDNLIFKGVTRLEENTKKELDSLYEKESDSLVEKANYTVTVSKDIIGLAFALSSVTDFSFSECFLVIQDYGKHNARAVLDLMASGLDPSALKLKK